MAKTKPKKPVRHLLKIGQGSYKIVLPPNLVRSLGWKDRQRLLVKRTGRGIIIRDALTRHPKKKK